MPTNLEALAIELLGLPAVSRARLGKQLIASLDDEEPPDLDQAAIAVARRRANELADRTVEGIPAEEVFRKLDEEFE